MRHVGGSLYTVFVVRLFINENPEATPPRHPNGVPGGTASGFSKYRLFVDPR